MHSALAGFGLGFLVVLQLGPMSLFLIRSTLRGGWGVGLAIGGGIAVVDGLYATVGAAGAGPLLAFHPLRIALGAAGAAVLVAMGARTLWSAFRVRFGGEVPAEAVILALGLPHVARRYGLQPGDDRLLGRHLRGGEHRGRGAHRFRRGAARRRGGDRQPDLGQPPGDGDRPRPAGRRPARGPDRRRRRRGRPDRIRDRARVRGGPPPRHD